ncbi:disease resistance protein RGA1 [Pyrus ussuriensis x Pyrus communis]|uniref:Disease resistance protein RGA1 n=1 Tax=Pyrus ussuriensis x Pyrus communis TaxID=2448454 RepID=A0A5N5FZB4_9ROSA|nr:disease resistance protein RGA1 [Pyrus ussuriensis x Pyrus communis]
MAELAFALAAKLIERLISIASEEICLAWGVKADLQRLGRTMSTIRDVLLDAEEKQALNKQLCNWLQQLNDVFLDAEDLLDEFECEALRRQVVRGSDTTRKVRHFFSRSNPVAFRLRVGHEIKDIRERLHELCDKNFADLRTVHHHPHLGDHVRENRNTTHSFVRASEVIGRETEKNKIVDLLMVQVGLGGLGKTTLAKLVYNDEKVVGSFELRMWQYVSVDFDATRLTKEILGSALRTQISEGLSLDQLQAQLRDALKDKKFLLVLDDVRNEDRIKWSELRDLLIEGAKIGSKILDSLSLFVKCAFEEGQERQHPSLYEMGKDIVRKCGGVPLAVKTLGSQLYSKTDEREWKLIRDSAIWKLEQEGAGHILPALRLSYNQLPTHLKQCLACCSILPKNYIEFNSRVLINDWMAHGILESREHGDMELEDVGELYFKELWQRSFFQNSLIVDSAGIKGISENVRHLLFFESGQNVSTALQKLNKVRTVAVERCGNIDESFLSTCISRFKYLRSLQTLNFYKCVNLEELPRNMRKLISLRWLELTTKQSSFPENGVGCLTSLRYLSIWKCSNLTCLPRDTSFLASLHTLIIGNCEQLDLVMENYQVIPLRLQKLWIQGVPRMTILPEWFQGATNTLQVLFIRDCENLEALPEWLTSFT